ncbi:MAG: N,N'-diacetylchitobiose phosphorylase, partial [Oscillospiraceae bacterium]|nr:N,N'-diacetylchitobiose phosphorylase [Oscillospiraceae bacterium]
MQYGYFDSKNREYVITNPATPEPWVNYLGSPEYGAIISGNAEGYSFVKSGANGRILRFRFNTKIGLPGRFIYIKDKKTGDYWSNAWQPVAKSLEEYKTQTRHGLGYTVVESEYGGVKSETAYYVPNGKTFEVWACTLTNTSKEVKNLEVTSFCEFTNHPNYEKDNVDLQYSRFVTKTEYKDNKLIQSLHHNDVSDTTGRRGIGLVGAAVDNAWGDLDKFIGNYRSYANPIGIEEKSETEKNQAYCGNCCGALQSGIKLNPNEAKTLIYIIGAYDAVELQNIMSAYEVEGKVESDLKEIKTFWTSKLDNLKINTPSLEFNEMVNT